MCIRDMKGEQDNRLEQRMCEMPLGSLLLCILFLKLKKERILIEMKQLSTVTEHLPSVPKALSLISSTSKTKTTHE